MALNKGEDNIERRERELYSRNAPQTPEQKRGSFTTPDYNVPQDWKTGDSLAKVLTEDYGGLEKQGTFFKKFFIGSLIFFVLAIATFLYMTFGGFNAVSSQNVDISVQGPVATDGGQELALEVSITNKNNVTLEDAHMMVEYPVGTRNPSDMTSELVRQQENVGQIAPGQSVVKTLKAVLYGEKDEIKKITISLDYKAQGSTATFSKEKVYDIAIKSSPVLFAVDFPKEVNSGQPMTMTITVTSNSATLMENMLVKTQYPFGFSFTDANPKPAFDNNIWNIGDLSPKEKRVIQIRGVMEGQNDEEKTFRFSAGTHTQYDEKTIDVAFVSTASSLVIRKPFFGMDLALNGDTSKDFVASLGSMVQGNLSWINNVSSTLRDVSVTVTLSGNALDRNRVSEGASGFYQSLNSAIVWDKRSDSVLGDIAPGKNGSFSFSFGMLPATSQILNAWREPQVTLTVAMKGTRLSDTEAPQPISYSFSRTVKIASETVFNPRAVYSIGPIDNRGQLPPRADKETTYTVLWTISNALNDLRDVSVSATLPPYVSWENVKVPASEKLSYDSGNNTVTWEPGEIKAGTGFGTSPREAAFQVSLIPSVNQVGTAPPLVNSVKLKGTDRFTGKQVLIEKLPITTLITTDPTFDAGDEIVVQ